MTRTAVDAPFLKRLVPLSALPDPLREHLAKNSQLQEVAPGDLVFHQGDTAETAVWLLEGEVELVRDGMGGDVVKGGSDGARHPLSPALPREQDARARTPVQVLVIERALLDSCLFWSQNPDEPDDPEAEDRSTEWIIRLSGSNLFTRIPPENLRRVFGRMERIQFLAGDSVVRQGQPGDYYYLIESGRCAVTRQVAAGEREVRLAELGPGDSFGEEALVADTRRNASVTMLTDGVLHRLTKEDFLDLIKTPLVRSLELAEARDMSRGGGVTWIDVRLPEEHQRSGIRGSHNIPLARLRAASNELSRDRRYVVYCDSGRRSAAGTFLLLERGFDAYHLKGGILHRRRAATGSGDSGPEPVARRLEAAAAQAARLHLELTRSNTEVAAAVASHGRASEAFDSEAAETARVLEEAQQRRKELAAASAIVQELTAAEMSAALEQENRFKGEAEARLRQGEARLEQEYARLCALIEAHQRKREAAVAAMSEARARIETEVRDKEQTLAALEARAREAAADLQQARDTLAGHQREAEQQYAALLDEERRLRSEGQERLHQERTRLEGEFAGVVSLLERIHRAREKAAESRRRAEEEARRMEQEAQARLARMKSEAEARIAAERQRLREEAEAARRQLEKAEALKKRAREALAQIQTRAHETRGEDATTRQEVAAELARKKEAAARAEAELAEANREKARIQESFQAVDQAEAEQDARMASLNQRLAAELDEWVSQELGQQDRAQAVRNQLLEDITRAQEEAERARQVEQQATAMMLAEIEAQLGAGDEGTNPQK